MSKWVGPDGEIGRYVREESESTLNAYRAQLNLVEEQANQEQDTARGGYADRQVVELVQNSADQIAKVDAGRIYIRLTDSHLYCADDGAPLDQDGAKALLFSHLSPKRATAEIGRFGVGFKSVLRVTDKPAVFSRSGSIQFDRRRAQQRIAEVAPNAGDYPVLRLAEPIEPAVAAKTDPHLAELMGWARNVVRLPLKRGARDGLAEQLRSFAPEFLLFVPHVGQLDLADDASEESRNIRLIEAGEQLELNDGGQRSRWMLFNREHELSDDAKADSRALDDADCVKIAWAAPLDARNPLQQFWAFFPTQTSSLVAGILNAPWKTNEDRQSLLPGTYNNELIGAAAQLVADSLPKLYAADAPARHLDVLPRREESGDNRHAGLLRRLLYARLTDAIVIPDQLGELRRLADIRIQPTALTPGRRVESAPLDRWRAYEHRPTTWLHHDALASERLGVIGRISVGQQRLEKRFFLAIGDLPGGSDRDHLSRASIAQWLTALTEAGRLEGDAIRASIAAIQTAALIPEASREGQDLGRIALRADGEWASLDPDSLYLGGDDPAEAVHPDLEADPETLKALQALGIRPPSPESAFRRIAASVLDRALDDSVAQRADDLFGHLWSTSRQLDSRAASEEITSHNGWADRLRVRTIAGVWQPVSRTLLPGAVVPQDGSRDAEVAIDVQFHHDDLSLLADLGLDDVPRTREGSSRVPRFLRDYLSACFDRFSQEAHPRRPRLDKVYLYADREIEPLDVLPVLTEVGRAAFTYTLLQLDATYDEWTVKHSSQDHYPVIKVHSFAAEALRQFGRVETSIGILPLADGLGDGPKSADVQRWLLQHPATRRIRELFPDLRTTHDGEIEVIGGGDPIPLLDVWPGLAMHIAPEQQRLDLTRCDRILDAATGRDLPFDCVQRGDVLIVAQNDDERAELAAVVRHLQLEIDDQALDAILRRETPADVEAARAKVRQQKTDAARLLVAVGGANLIYKLPRALVELLSGAGQGVGELDAAKAAIATFHTGALREYRHAIEHLRPPRQWAGRPAALEFVAALGFGPEWAGQPNPKRDPFIDVAGPRSLPDLHDYQQAVVGNVKAMLSRGPMSGENRGLLSLPTGSGKTRVAVQAIIEAIRDDGFRGTVLWVADRDELCEQAVEVWQQAWASIGPEAQPLRVSRWWGRQRSPQAPGGHHVVVATIQTLRARIERGAAAEVLEDVAVLVVDEAHGSIAPSYTQLMSELGLTFRRTEDEIALLGLTATPYRGIDAVETERLVRRYGTNRLDFGAFDSDDPEKVISRLQEMTVLADVDHDVITGATVQLTEKEKEQATDTPWLPDSVEERLAEDTGRTNAIVHAYKTQVRAIDPNAPALIFATSVAHAKTIAAVLSLDGIAARAVSGKTETSVRRSIVEQFRAGEIDVLVNYNVFREGFDAPKTRAIIVARPVYSPNLYFQMIGRGLRGELNGGSERCLILDVEDNIENYEGVLAFSDLDWLWS